MEDLDLNEQQAVRRAKLAVLRDLGIDPFPARLPRGAPTPRQKQSPPTKRESFLKDER